MGFFIGELDGGRGEIGGLAEVDDGAALAKPQAEVVPAAEVGGCFFLFDRIGESADRGAADEDSVAEVEIVADAAELIVDEWMGSDRAVGLQIEIVGVQNGGLGIVGRLSETLQRVGRQLDTRRQRPKQVRRLRRLEPAKRFDDSGRRSERRGVKGVDLVGCGFAAGGAATAAAQTSGLATIRSKAAADCLSPVMAITAAIDVMHTLGEETDCRERRACPDGT